jgi:RNA polymerase sigma factor (sigma-70 family)
VITIVRDPALAEDVAQDAFARAWRYAASYDARRGSVNTWLLTIARNASIDTLRLRGAEPADPEAVTAELDLSQARGEREGSSPELGERERLREVLFRLPMEQRRALVLSVYLGRTAQEISDLDSVALGTVKTRLRTGLMHLRAELEVTDEV